MADLSSWVVEDLPPTTAAGLRLLDAAEELFYLRGIGAVSVDLVAETAGVTKRTLYQRYGSKAALVAAYLTRRARRWQQQVLAELSEVPRDHEQVLAVFRLADVSARASSRGCAFVNARAELGAGDHPALAVITAEKRWMRELFEALIDSVPLAHTIHLMYEGAHVVNSTMGDLDAFTHAAELVREQLQSK